MEKVAESEKPLTDLASEMAKAWNEADKSAKEWADTINKHLICQYEKLLSDEIHIWLGYVLKQVGATFLTRWYWKKKMKKSMRHCNGYAVILKSQSIKTDWQSLQPMIDKMEAEYLKQGRWK